MQCPLCGGEVAEHGPYVVLLEDRDGAGNESTGSHFAGGGEKDHAMVGSRKNGGRDGAVEKTRGGKVKKPTFPPRLEIPQTPAGFPLSHSLGDCGRLTKTGHFICYEKRTFLMS
jgi:hypothetical protein